MSSFRKRATASQPALPPGTRLNPHSGTLLMSTGVPALDDVLGGGLPVGGILLIEEDRRTGYSSTLLSFFASQAIASGHQLCVVDADHDVDPRTQFPGWAGAVRDEPTPSQGARPSDSAAAAPADPMKIAWRYQNLPQVGAGSDEPGRSGGGGGGAGLGVPFCEHFDLSLRIPAAVVDAARIDILDADALAQMAGDERCGGDTYRCVLDKIAALIDDGYSSLKPVAPDTVRGILRIELRSLGSGLWHGSDSQSILRFLHGLRGLLRYSYATCVASFPGHLYEDGGGRLPVVRRVEHLCDAVVELESFEGARVSPAEIVARQARARAGAAAAAQDYHGFVHIHKLPRLNSLTASTGRLSLLHTGGGSANNLAFRLRRKKFSIETYHLPIEGSVGERRVPADGHGSTSSRTDPLAF
ncbi:Elongator subunit elp4 [Coemansia spiralis]|nr:Elongator subunit elp4 [Coemansia spiralis]